MDGRNRTKTDGNTKVLYSKMQNFDRWTDEHEAKTSVHPSDTYVRLSTFAFFLCKLARFCVKGTMKIPTKEDVKFVDHY